jgi:DNA invertase Pin-like site-specific DNA recombinase
MLASFAEFERGTIRERTKADLMRAYKKGKHTGVIPYGYRVDEQSHFVIAPEEAKIVRQIFEHIADGATVYSQAKRLSDEGVRPPGVRYRSGRSEKNPASTRWGTATVRNLIHQRLFRYT